MITFRLSIFDDNKTQEEFVIEISYSGSPQNLGMGSFNFEEKNDRKYVYTLSEPVYASTWFPCNDLPDDKALGYIRITNDSSSVSISNGVLANIEIDGDKKTYSWEILNPISTYLIAIYSGEYKKFSQQYTTINNKIVNFDYYVTPENYKKAQVDFNIHPKIFKVFEELFGEYAFADEKYSVVEFFWPYGAMEHQTVTGMGSRFIGGKNFFKDIYIHEVAHHWWGNAVGPRTWKDVWMNEGFSTYSEALYWEKVSGRSSLISTLQSKFRDYPDNSLYSPGPNMFGSMVYNKGAWVLHMLRKEIGDENFFNLLRNYFNTYKYKNASTDDFKILAENISNKDLTTFFNQWVYFGKGVIILEYNFETVRENSRYITELKLSQFSEEYNAFHFPLDVNLKSTGGKMKSFNFYISNYDTTITLQTDFNPDEIVLDPDNWLMAIISEASEDLEADEEINN
jgi:aminopeptidase N